MNCKFNSIEGKIWLLLSLEIFYSNGVRFKSSEEANVTTRDLLRNDWRCDDCLQAPKTEPVSGRIDSNRGTSSGTKLDHIGFIGALLCRRSFTNIPFGFVQRAMMPISAPWSGRSKAVYDLWQSCQNKAIVYRMQGTSGYSSK